MGNGSSNSAYVALNKNVAFPGDVLGGCLYVVITQPISIQSITIFVRGYEDIRWQDEVSDPVGVEHNQAVRAIRSSRDRIDQYSGNEEFRMELESARRDLAAAEQRLVMSNRQRSLKGLVPSQGEVSETMLVERRGGSEFFKFAVPVGGPGQPFGQYSFPFSFRLPEGIPGSFSYVNGTTSANLIYDITGVIAVPGMMSSFISSNITHTVRFHVIERPLSMSRLACAVSTNIYTCCCFNNGSVSLETSAEKNSYSPGENMQVALDVVNNSSKNIKQFEITLVSVLTLQARGAVYGTTATKTIETIRSSVTVDGVPSKKSISGLFVALPVPNEAEQQCLGACIRHYYYFKVQGVIDWASDAVMKVPVVISVISPQFIEPDIPQAPANWQPAVAPSVDIVLPQQPEMTRGLELNQFDNLKTI